MIQFFTKKYFSIFLILSSVLVSCSGSKSMYKKGLKLEQAGMYSEASNFYYDALKRDITNVDASIRLNNLAQVILSDKLDEFEKSINNGHKQNAVYSYFSAKSFVEKLRKVNINLNIPEQYSYDFRKAKSEDIDEELDNINSLLDENKFVEANKVIKEVLKIDPNNQEVRDLDGYSTAEPIYRKAMLYFEKGDFKKAFYEFDKVLNYKDAREIKNLAKEKATTVVVIRPIDNDSEYYDLDERLTMNIEELFSESKNPFLKIIKSDVYKRLLSEKKYSKNKSMQEHTSRVFDADVFFDVSIINVEVSNGRLSETRKKGWELYRRKIKNEETDEVKYINDFRKVYYYEYSRTKLVALKLNYQLKSFNTNEVVFSKFDEDRVYDEVEYLDFEGEKNNLRSGYWVTRTEENQRDVIGNSNGSIRDIRNKLNGRRTMSSTHSMENKVIDNLSESMVYEIDKYISSLK